MTAKSAYARAGVDIDEQTAALSAIKRLVKGTATKGVVSELGSFGGMFRSPGKDHVLVASTDGVGTKLKVAAMAGRHNTVGSDLVNHCVNDILVQGAKPLFFLDYIGTSALKATVFKEIVCGLSKACKANGCALLGGETAEMPGLYPQKEYDLVGTIVGSVAHREIVTGQKLKPGDVLIGLKSSGLHTNGYSLARKIVFEKAGLETDDTYPGLKVSVADALLAVHLSYLKPVTELMTKVRVRAMAHITGGGLVDNVPRVLPEDTLAVIDRGSWKTPGVFRFLQDKGNVAPEEMYRVFNMGIGFVIAVRKKEANTALEMLRKSRSRPSIIGAVEKGKRSTVLNGETVWA